MIINPFSAETGILQDKWVDTMAADALAPCVARASASMVLTMQDKQLLVFHKERFQRPVLSQDREMIENTNVFSCFLKWIQYEKG